ncbi:hypothetical protein ABT063_08410 [Streptomyces sp. NPDC002838]|uniref:effector-associated constant component EACC1 n=1 Tax=Streptomyces sp. NPDC002838 TaxID=3154436 RepID=UPI0033215876
MGSLLAIIGSALSSGVAAASVAAAITAWRAARGRREGATITIERNGKTIAITVGDANDEEEVQRVVAQLMEDSKADENEVSAKSPPSE